MASATRLLPECYRTYARKDTTVTTGHDHSKPGRAAQLATMALVKAIIADDRPAIRRAAIAGGCPACNAVAVMTWMFAFTSELTGAKFERLAPVMLAAIEATDLDLRSGDN